MNIDLNSLPKVGEPVEFKHKGATIQMTVQNARIRYGQIDVLLAPVSGTGSFWVTYASVKLPATPIDAALAS